MSKDNSFASFYQPSYPTQNSHIRLLRFLQSCFSATMGFTLFLAAAAIVARTLAAPFYDCAGSDLCYSIPIKHCD